VDRSNSKARPAGRLVARLTVVLVTLAIASLALAPVVSSATLTNAWQAKIGSAGANGTAKIQAYDTGVGTLVLKLAKMKASTLLPVTLYKGTCSSTVVLLKLASIKTTSAGAASRTSSLTAAQVNSIKSATKGTGRISIRVGSSTTGGVKCGLFAAFVVPPPPAQVTAKITVGAFPTDVLVTPTGVLVANSPDWEIEKIDPATNSALFSIELPLTGLAGITTLASGEGALWAATLAADSAGTQLPGSLLRLDPASGQVTATIPIGKLPMDLATSPGAVWVTNYLDGTVMRIDTVTNQVAATVTLDGRPTGVAYDFGSVWVTNDLTGAVLRIDPATNQVVATIATVGDAAGVTTGGGAVWVTNWGTEGQPDGVLSRIDPATNAVVRTIPVGTNPWWLAYGGGYVWIAMDGEPTVVQVNATTNALQSRLQVGGEPMGIAATDHVVWATVPVASPDPNSPTPPGTLVKIQY
jgi:YVTN family beta-propeller protein